MKGFFLMMIVSVLLVGCSITMEDPKRIACINGCNRAAEECIRQADGDPLKTTACNIEKEKCLRNCRKYSEDFIQ